MSSSCRFDEETPQTAGGLDFELLQAMAGLERRIASGIAHDVNSALQGLGDSLFCLRQDLLVVMDAQGGDTTAMDEIGISLDLASSAYERLSSIATALPRLVANVANEAGPINLESELSGLAPLTWHEWKHRAEIVVDVESNVASFWCPWWIARFAVLRLLLDAIANQCSDQDTQKAIIHLAGARRDDAVEVRLHVDRPGASDLGDRAAAALDPIAESCARRLGGELFVQTRNDAVHETVLRFPVSPTPRIGEVS